MWSRKKKKHWLRVNLYLDYNMMLWRLFNRLLNATHNQHSADDILNLLTFGRAEELLPRGVGIAAGRHWLLKLQWVTSFNDSLNERDFSSWKRVSGVTVLFLSVNWPPSSEANSIQITRIESGGNQHDIPECNLQLEHCAGHKFCAQKGCIIYSCYQLILTLRKMKATLADIEKYTTVLDADPLRLTDVVLIMICRLRGRWDVPNHLITDLAPNRTPFHRNFLGGCIPVSRQTTGMTTCSLRKDQEVVLMNSPATRGAGWAICSSHTLMFHISGGWRLW